MKSNKKVWIDGSKATSYNILMALLKLGSRNDWGACSGNTKNYLYFINDSNLIDCVSKKSCKAEWLQKAWKEIIPAEQ